jgi:flagellar assembly protein FliH
MSSRARRLALSSTAAAATPVAPWLEAVAEGVVPAIGRRPAQRVIATAASVAAATPVLAPPPPAVSANQEQEIFAKGYAQGEKAAAAAAQQQHAALSKQLSASVEELTRVRAEMIRHTERQMVQLALGVARRIVHREVSTDAAALTAMMHAALDRLSHASRVTIRLNPADHQSVTAALPGALTGMTLTADPRVPRGGCKVESEFGDIDAGVDAQIQEIARGLFGEAGAHG